MGEVRAGKAVVFSLEGRDYLVAELSRLLGELSKRNEAERLQNI
jgi:hypothetical protein